jgi:N-acetylglutamate synthase
MVKQVGNRMIGHFEEISNNAWPALQTLQYDGWVLRFANGVTKRSNSVSLLYPSTLPPDEKISFCEHLYASQQITPCFKITEIATPSGLDQRLAEQGYFIHSHISFQTLDISKIPSEPLGNITMEGNLKPRWMDDFIRMNEFDHSRKSTYISIMKQLLLPKCLISLTHDKKTIGVGLGVAEGSFVGLFDIVVDKAHRNTGLGYLIVENILRWGRKHGANTAYLQVLTDNAPALGLYKKMGFKEAYRYWYRMKR